MENFGWFEYLIITIAIYAFLRRIMKAEVIYEAKLHSNPIEVKIENIQGHIYLWNKATDDFLAQGPTFDNAVKVLEIRFPGTKFVMNKEEYHKTNPTSMEV